MAKKVIITQLVGGLGNQMFQYATGLALARKTGRLLQIDTALLRDHRSGLHFVNRNLDLNIFQSELHEVSLWTRIRYNANGLSWPWKIFSRMLRILSPRSVLKEKSFSYHPMESQVASHEIVYLSGLWQSWKYFSSIENEIRAAFRFRQDLPGDVHDLLAQIQDPQAVILHIRRGDYLSIPANAEKIGFVGLDYYRRAVDIMTRDMSHAALFVVFSDDMEWCRTELTWLPGSTCFVSYCVSPQFKSHHVDFQLMSHGRRFIISNSTFAWWAAWLSRTPDKTVIAPSQWFRDRALDATDLCPSDWVRL
jgi:hypothetical protein